MAEDDFLEGKKDVEQDIHALSVIEPQKQIYEKLRQKIEELIQKGMTKEEALTKLLVLSRNCDPYFFGKDIDIKRGL